MFTSLKRKRPQTPSSHRFMGTSSKRQAIGSHNRFGNAGTSSSGQRGESSNLNSSKFKPNSKAEAWFNCSFKTRPVFVSLGILLKEFLETLIYSYFTKWVWKRFSVSEGVVCLELLREFYANIHASDKEARTLKSYVRWVYLDFSISNICTFHQIQPLDPKILGSHILHL